MNVDKKLIYIANVRLPTEKAHGVQIMKTCEALANQGVQVELVVPDRRNFLRADPFDFYKVNNNFTITRLKCWDLISDNRWGRAGYWLESLTFFYSLKKYLRSTSDCNLYTRDLPIAFLLGVVGKSFYYEIHTLPDKIGWFYKQVWRRATGLMVISGGIKNDLIKNGVASAKIFVVPDAVDIKQFTIAESRSACRKLLKIPLDKLVAAYSGHLYAWKGASTLAEAAELLPEIEIYLVGGTADDVRSFKDKYKQFQNLHIVGWQEHRQIPYWLKAADVLILPNSGRQKIGAIYTSPLKLFEYMATERPMVVSDLPAIREVVDETSATLFEADNPASLAQSIRAVFQNMAVAEAKAKIARAKVDEFYSWDTRAVNIASIIIGKN
ncbi:MAG: glycosyltransferase [bacterium]|nr:glycosyltransferase [bacterium]